MKKEINIQLTRTQWITVVLSVISLVLMIGAIYWHSLILSFASLVKEDRQAYNQEVRYSQTITQMKKDLEFANEAKGFIDTLYIDGNNVISFIEFIESLARSAGVSSEIEDLKIEEGELTMLVDVSGSWREVNTFVIMLENVPYHLVVDELNISSFAIENGSGWRVSMGVKGYVK